MKVLKSKASRGVVTSISISTSNNPRFSLIFQCTCTSHNFPKNFHKNKTTTCIVSFSTTSFFFFFTYYIQYLIFIHGTNKRNDILNCINNLFFSFSFSNAYISYNVNNSYNCFFLKYSYNCCVRNFFFKIKVDNVLFKANNVSTKIK